MDVLRDIGQENRGLASRVSSSHYDDLPLATEQRFHCGCRVVDATIFKLSMVRDGESSVLCATCDDYGTRTYNNSSGQREVMDSINLLCGYYFARDRKVYAKLQRLQVTAARELLAGNARRKAKIVFNLRTRPRLAAGRCSLDHDG